MSRIVIAFVALFATKSFATCPSQPLVAFLSGQIDAKKYDACIKQRPTAARTPTPSAATASSGAVCQAFDSCGRPCQSPQFGRPCNAGNGRQLSWEQLSWLQLAYWYGWISRDEIANYLMNQDPFRFWILAYYYGFGVEGAKSVLLSENGFEGGNSLMPFQQQQPNPFRAFLQTSYWPQ